jgi:hypothetical protein
MGDVALMGLIFNDLEIDRMSNYLNVFVKETFEQNGEEKSNFTKVGVAFPHTKGEGMNLKITAGIAVSGDLVLFPPREGEES